ncbi:NAD(P)-dependent oxidoreductase [Desulfovibrio sp. An276]|uniref:NAD(P)-dependent oxidoreductase n=1 Tax=Desulfovibrio sp. An276 TaxID=1965618 RepID=UPI00194E60A4|nr:NAD(P)-dependent oxidoreductase [Desulfovibrio sp. An276]
MQKLFRKITLTMEKPEAARMYFSFLSPQSIQGDITVKIVLLEGLGVDAALVASKVQKLESMGHTFQEFAKNTDPEVQLEEAKDADVIMIANMPLAKKVVEECPNLKFIDVAFTGVDHIPVAEAKARGIAVSNASGYADTGVAELAIGFMIDLLRNVPGQEKSVRQGGTKLPGRLLQGKTVGIVGAGHIGKKTAALCKAFGCRLLAYNRSKVTDPVFDRQVSLEELLKESDIVSLHCPLNDGTRNLINADALKLMKKTAYLINTARGPVVDGEALAKALEDGVIAGAALDVFDIEPPLPTDHVLLKAPNCIVTPHMAFASVESMEARCDIVFDNLFSWLEGKQQNVIC